MTNNIARLFDRFAKAVGWSPTVVPLHVVRVSKVDPWYDHDNGIRVRLNDGRVCRQMLGIGNWLESSDGGKSWDEVDKRSKQGERLVYDLIAPAVREFRSCRVDTLGFPPVR